MVIDRDRAAHVRQSGSGSTRAARATYLDGRRVWQRPGDCGSGRPTGTNLLSSLTSAVARAAPPFLLVSTNDTWPDESPSPAVSARDKPWDSPWPRGGGSQLGVSRNFANRSTARVPFAQRRPGRAQPGSERQRAVAESTGAGRRGPRLRGTCRLTPFVAAVKCQLAHPRRVDHDTTAGTEETTHGRWSLQSRAFSVRPHGS